MSIITTPAARSSEATRPPAGTWDIDPGHTDLAFIGRHLLVTKVRGRFTGVTGVVAVAEDVSLSRVEVDIDMRTVESGNAARDEHLRSAELFDVERFPSASFRSTRVDWQGDRGVVVGDLTIHGVTREVPLEVTYEGRVQDPWGGDRAIFSAAAAVNREDFGVTWNMVLEAGGLLVSKDITIDIAVETVLEA